MLSITKEGATFAQHGEWIAEIIQVCEVRANLVRRISNGDFIGFRFGIHICSSNIRILKMWDQLFIPKKGRISCK